MNYTGVFVTEEEKEKCAELAEEARNTPVIKLSGSMEDFATSAWKSVYNYINGLAKKYGLPETPGDYGLSNEGEIISQY